MRIQTKPPNVLRKLSAVLAAAGLVLMTLITGVVKAPPAAAADPFPQLSCDANTIYAVNGSGDLRQVTTGANSITVAGTNTAEGLQRNGLAITPGGDTAYTVDNGTDSTRTIGIYRAGATDIETLEVDVEGGYSDWGIRGAYDRVSGLYYFGGYRQVAAYNPETQRAFKIGTLVDQDGKALGNNNGDWAFGSDGTLYVLSGNTLYFTSEPLPTSQSDADIHLEYKTTLKGLDNGIEGTAPNGIAFGAGGRLYISYGTGNNARIAEYDLETGTRGVVGASPSFVSSDLGSCIYPNTLALQVDVERFAPGDQFGMTISHGGESLGSSVTTGDADGLQNKSAGPVFTENDEPYQLAVTPAGGTDLNNYTGSMSCVNVTTGEELEPGGAAFEWTLDFPGVLGTDAVCTVTLTPKKPGLELTKVSDPQDGAGVEAGDKIEYTVTAENTGKVSLNPVEVTDSLAGVLDNATYNDDAAVELTGDGTTEDGPALSEDGKSLAWTGSLDPGAKVTLTYSVTVKDGAKSGEVTNTVSAKGTPPTGEPVVPEDVTTEHPIVDPGFVIEKSSDPASGETVKRGETITYTVIGKNTGNVALDPATIDDNLSNVFANATYNGDAAATTGIVSVDGNNLNWSGALQKGESVTITYSVTVNEDAAATSVKNVVNGSGTPLLPTGDPEEPTEPGEPITPPEQTTEHPLNDPGFDLTKTSNPESGARLSARDEVTYTVTGTNSGNLKLQGVTIIDDLAAVLATADLVAGPTTAGPEGAADAKLEGDVLSWTGDLAPGESVTITYTVKVDDPATAKFLENLVEGEATPLIPDPEDPDNPIPGEPINPPDAGTFHPIYEPAFDIAKIADPESGTHVMPNQVVTYALKGSNTGNLDLKPVVLTDNLAEVLVNAEYQGDAEAWIGLKNVSEGLTYDADTQTLTWTGDLAYQEAVLITYSVKVNSFTDLPEVDKIANTLTGVATPLIPNPEDPDNPTEGDPITPPEEVTEHPIVIPCLCLDKVADPASGTAVKPGEEVTYTVTATNARDDANLVDVTVTDDLTEVLKYADLDKGSVKDEWTGTGDPGTGDFDNTADSIVWEGNIPTGQVLTITYTVKVHEDADLGLLQNVVQGKGYVQYGENPPLEDPIIPPSVTTNHPVVEPDFQIVKQADPVSGSAVDPGQVVTYTVTGTNTGNTVLDPAEITDDLSEVLANAALVEGPAADVGTLEFDDATATLSWEGVLGQGESVTISYAVQVSDDASGVTLNNVAAGGAIPLIPTDPTNPESPTKPGQPITPPEAETSHPVLTPRFEVTKGADPASETAVNPGQEITYTVTGKNTGDTNLGDVKVTDNLAEVLAYADLVGSPSANVGDAPKVEGDQLIWTGDLDEGQAVTITYTVKVKATEDVYGQLLNNVAQGVATPLLPNPEDPEDPIHGDPIPTDPVQTEHPVNTPAFELAKSVDPAAGTSVDPGDVLTYTVTATNTGETVLDPVLVEDDLSDVVKYADREGPATAAVDGNSVGGLTDNGDSLAWEGTLQPGEVLTITYQVKVSGDAVGENLENVATAAAYPPGSDPEDPNSPLRLTPPPRDTNNPVNVPGLSINKQADPQSSSDVDPGQVITYTVKSANTGTLNLDPAVVTDDLSQVLPYAVYNNDAVALVNGESAGEVVFNADAEELVWTGTLKGDRPGQEAEEVVITYSVTVKADAGGQTLENVAFAEGTPPGNAEKITTPRAITDHYVNEPGFEIITSVDPAGAVDPGALVTYTVTGTNTGETALDPVTVTDDVSLVLENAQYNDDAVAVVGDTAVNAPTLEDGTLSWQGALAVGESVTITYSVTVNADAGGATLHNLVVGEATGPGGDPEDPNNPPFTITPPPPGTETPVNEPGFEVTKASKPKAGAAVKAGDKVSYTVTGANTGQTDLSDVTVTDDLSKVLPYATYNNDAAATVDGKPAGALNMVGDKLEWTGSLKEGQSVTITYSVTVKTGVEGKQLVNKAGGVAVPPGGPAITPPEVSTENPVKGALPVTGARSIPFFLGLGAALLAGGLFLNRRGRSDLQA